MPSVFSALLISAFATMPINSVFTRFRAVDMPKTSGPSLFFGASDLRVFRASEFRVREHAEHIFVRSVAWPEHPWPNHDYVRVTSASGLTRASMAER